jgi:hypothetical protein
MKHSKCCIQCVIQSDSRDEWLDRSSAVVLSSSVVAPSSQQFVYTDVVPCVYLHFVWVLQENAARAAGMIAAFCERIGLPALDLIVSKFQGRVLHGIKEDIIDLTNIMGIRGFGARLLYSAGLQTVEAVAKASVEEVHAALVQGKRPQDLQGEWKQARRIHNSAIKLWRVRPVPCVAFDRMHSCAA